MQPFTLPYTNSKECVTRVLKIIDFSRLVDQQMRCNLQLTLAGGQSKSGKEDLDLEGEVYFKNEKLILPNPRKGLVHARGITLERCLEEDPLYKWIRGDLHASTERGYEGLNTLKNCIYVFFRRGYGINYYVKPYEIVKVSVEKNNVLTHICSVHSEDGISFFNRDHEGETVITQKEIDLLVRQLKV